MCQRHLGSAAAYLLFAGMMVWILSISLSESVELATNGTWAVGTVERYDYKRRTGRRGRTYYAHTHAIRYDGHLRSFSLDHRHANGRQLDVLYLPDDPQTARVTDTQSVLGLAKEDTGGWFGLVLLPTFALGIGLVGGLELKKALNSPDGIATKDEESEP